MTAIKILLLTSSAFAGTIAAYPVLANQNGWPRGFLYLNGMAGFLYLGTMIFGLTFIGTLAYNQRISWWFILWFVLISFAGAATIPSIFKKYSGAASIIGAPLFMLLAVLIR